MPLGAADGSAFDDVWSKSVDLGNTSKSKHNSLPVAYEIPILVRGEVESRGGEVGACAGLRVV